MSVKESNIEFPQTNIPVLSLRNLVLFPSQTIPVWVSSDQSIKAVEAARASDGWILGLKTKDHKASLDQVDNLHRLGTLAKIEQIRRHSDRTFQIVLNSYLRFEAETIVEANGFLVASGGQRIDKVEFSEATLKALDKSLRETASQIFDLLPTDMSRFQDFVESIQDTSVLAHTLAQHISLDLESKQGLLEEDSVKARILKLLDLMVKYKDELIVQKEIGAKISSELTRKQRDAILREQLKAIQEQLGEGDTSQKADELRERIEAAQMPPEVRQVALEQLRRLEALGSINPESHVVRNYLELLCSLPWAEPVSKEIDLYEAQKILDADHYGLNKIKDRIIEHLAILKLKKDSRGSILLFVGPPGVGKTSLGKSIAKALGREFVRTSLGGVRDDAEIRGHRRTYVGAMPGRIIDSIKRVKARNPVFLLDEIDKLSRSFGGDPASALLEVLDPEQNSKFLDHYLDVPFDLSKVIFIATANSLDTIPGPLLDRMEVIQLSGYTNEEKFQIAKRHLVPRQLEEYGISMEDMIFEDEALRHLIQGYTREAGVRELQRQIAAVARAMARDILSKKKTKPLYIRPAEVEEVLGPERYISERVQEDVPSGVVTGLAWTPMGGEILFIESSLMPGSGKLNITGQLGEVMKESSQIALSLARVKLPEKNLSFSQNDIHIHVPAGAIPKDGPSAGLAILTSLISLFLKRKVDPKLAMTGEITLRGAVLPVGGIKEKVIAAHRAGVREVILSSKNQKDLREVPDEVKNDLKFHFVEDVKEALSIALRLPEEEFKSFWQEEAA